MVRWISTAGVALLCALALPAAAAADTGDIIAPQHSPPTASDGWQAGGCNFDVPECSPKSPPAQYSAQAATHPPIGFTQFIVKDDEAAPGVNPVGRVKDI